MYVAVNILENQDKYKMMLTELGEVVVLQNTLDFRKHK